MDQFLALSLLDGCIGWLGGLTLIVVGLVVGRRANDLTAGFVIAGAGALKLFLNCCVIAPALVRQFGSVDLDLAVLNTNIVLVQLQRLAFFGLIAAGMTRLANPREAEASS